MKRNTEIPSNWNLPQHIVERIGLKAGKQRVIAEQENLLIVLHKVPKKNENSRSSVFLWRNENARWSSSERGNGLGVLDEHLSSYENAEQDLDQLYQNASKAADYLDLLEQISPIQRAANNMRNTLQSARELTGSEMIDYRDKSEEISRNFDLLYADCRHGLEYAVAKKAEEQSELQRKALTVSHRLNVTMALCLPVTAVASLLGMNLQHGLDGNSPLVFTGVVVICAVLGVAMKSWITRK